MVVYTVSYSFSNVGGGFHATNYSSGITYINAIVGNQLNLTGSITASNIILSNSTNNWNFPSMIGSQYALALQSNINLTTGGLWYNVVSYTIPQAGVYNIHAQFICLFGDNTGSAVFACSISTISATSDTNCISQYIYPSFNAFNHFSQLNRIIQITNTTTTMYMVVVSNYWSVMPVMNNQQNILRITRIA